MKAALVGNYKTRQKFSRRRKSLSEGATSDTSKTGMGGGSGSYQIWDTLTKRETK